MNRALAMMLVLGCGGDVGSQSARILNGAYDTTDTSVVAVLVTSTEGPQNDSLCSGTVVSPHVVLTAAHCLDPIIVGPIDHVTIFTGQNALDPIQTADPQNLIAVAKTTFDHDFQANSEPPSHDLAMLTTQTAMTLAPMPLNHSSLGSGDIGAAAHSVGYGQLDGTNPDSAGVRRSLDTTLFDVTDEHIILSDVVCEGDSGGPTFITKNGVSVVAGVHSYTDAQDCSGTGGDTRVDRYTGEIDDAINAADPGFLPSGCNTSSGSGDAWLIALALVATVRARTPWQTRPRSSRPRSATSKSSSSPTRCRITAQQLHQARRRAASTTASTSTASSTTSCCSSAARTARSRRARAPAPATAPTAPSRTSTHRASSRTSPARSRWRTPARRTAARCQFFINTVHNSYLDWFTPGASKHPVFGKVIEGMDVVSRRSRRRRPTATIARATPVRMNKITIQK